jgi:hypothetical protein
VGYLFLRAWASSVGGDTPLHELIDTLWRERYGLRTAITGLAPDGSLYEAQRLFYEGAPGLRPWLGAWISASALWLAGSLGIATLAARRQPRG